MPQEDSRMTNTPDIGERVADSHENGAMRICGHTHWLPPTVGPDGLPTRDEQSRYWFRSTDGTFQLLPGEHTNKSWREGPAAQSFARAAHLPED